MRYVYILQTMQGLHTYSVHTTSESAKREAARRLGVPLTEWEITYPSIVEAYVEGVGLARLMRTELFED